MVGLTYGLGTCTYGEATLLFTEIYLEEIKKEKSCGKGLQWFEREGDAGKPHSNSISSQPGNSSYQIVTHERLNM